MSAVGYECYFNTNRQTVLQILNPLHSLAEVTAQTYLCQETQRVLCVMIYHISRTNMCLADIFTFYCNITMFLF